MAHILAVDDDPDLCTLLKTALERDGHAVEIRTSGVTVTESLCRWADCILLDVMMPGEDGFATCRRIRAITQAPILFLTARTDEQSVLTGLGIGADDYLTKPFGTEELLARIRAAVRHTRTPEGAAAVANSGVFTAGELTIDYDKHRVYIAGRDANLTQNEYKLVALLGLHAGKVLTYDYLIKELWGPSARSDNQILRVNMANIRRKIEKNPAQPAYIFTESGVGYRMVEGD